MAVFMTVQLFQTPGSFDLFPKLALFIADSSDEAQRKSLAKILEEYPPSNGYFNHAITLGEIPKEVLEKFIASARSEKEIDFSSKIKAYTLY